MLDNEREGRIELIASLDVTPPCCHKGGSILAIYHLSAQIIGRSAGLSAVAAAAYRAGIKLVNESTGERYDYQPKEKNVLASGIEVPKDAPAWASDRSKLWNSVEAKEARKNSQFCREFNIALPKELTHEQHVAAIKAYSTLFTRMGLVADWSIHAPHKNDDGSNNGNYHAHIMMTTRPFDKTLTDGWSKNKNRDIDDHEWLKKMRKGWEIVGNSFLEKAGQAERIDCRSLEEQGITDREPQIHLGVTATAMKRRGVEIDRKQEEINPIVVTAKEVTEAVQKDPLWKRIQMALALLAKTAADYATFMSGVIGQIKKGKGSPEQEENRRMLFSLDKEIEAARAQTEKLAPRGLSQNRDSPRGR